MTGDEPSGPRVPPVTDPEPAVEELLAKTLVDGRGMPLNIFTTLAHHPRLLRRFNALGGLFLMHGELSARERELVVLRTAWRSGSEYEWGQHVLIGRRAGLSDAEIAGLARPVDTGPWSAEDAALLRFTDEVLAGGDAGNDTWEAQRKRWSDAQLIELVVLIGFYRMVATFLNTTRVQSEDELPGWPAPPHRQP